MSGVNVARYAAGYFSTLPNEFKTSQIQAAARQLRHHLRRSRSPPSRRPPFCSTAAGAGAAGAATGAVGSMPWIGADAETETGATFKQKGTSVVGLENIQRLPPGVERAKKDHIKVPKKYTS